MSYRCELRFLPKNTPFRFLRGRKTYLKLSHRLILQTVVDKDLYEVTGIGKAIKLTEEDKKRIVVRL